MNKKFKKIVMILSVLSLTLASTHLAIKADNAENAGGGHEATSVTAEATTTEPTAQDNQVQVEAVTTAPESTEELSDDEMTSGAMTVADGPVAFDDADFDVTGVTVNGFSAEGLEKAKKMTAESVLTFPANVTTIGAGAFKYDKIESQLPNGIVGKVVFHGGITYVGNNAFQGNPEITEVVVDEGNSIFFGVDSFCPIKENIVADKNSFEAHENFFNGKERGKLSKLTINRKKFDTYTRAFAFTNIESLDLSSTTEKGEIQEFTFYGSGLKEVKSLGATTLINNGAFANTDLESILIPKSVETIFRDAFRGNKKLTSVTFEERDNKGIMVSERAFKDSNITGTLQLVGGVEIQGDRVFGNNNITKVTTTGKIAVGWNAFEGNPLESVEKLYTYGHFEGSSFAGADDRKTLKNVSFMDSASYEDKGIKSIPNNAFSNGLLRSVEVPSHFTEFVELAFKNNIGWIEGDSRVAIYRKNGDIYVTDNDYGVYESWWGHYAVKPDVKDTDNFVINPVFVTYELKNQYGVKITDKEINLVVDADRNGNKTEDVAISKEGNRESFKLGDSLTLKGTDIEGLTLKAVNGEEYKADTALTIDPTKTIEVIYGPDYKIGYKKFVISLTYNDPNAKDPNAVIYIEPIVPNNDTNNNNDNNSNNNNTDNTVSPSIIPNEDLSIDALPTEIVEEDIDIDGENTPLGANDIVEGEEEDLEIEGDETPLGKGKIDGKDGKKNTGILAKTGGLHVMLYQMLGLLAVLILGYFGFTFVAKKKKSER